MTDPIPKITRKLKSRVTDRFGHYYKNHLSLLLHFPSITQKPNAKMLRDINEHSDATTLQLLLENLKDLESQQKGKQAAGECTDQEVAINYLREDILAAQVSVQDGILALSTSTAVATDQNILASIRDEENIAEQDRRYALAFSNGELAVHDTPTPHESTLAWVDEDAVSVAMSDLMSRIKIKDDNGESSSRSIPPSQKSNLTKQCVSCLEKVHTSMFKSSCGHELCHDCITQMFLGAIKDEELYPPRCCGEVVPPEIALRVLSYAELRDFSQRAIEWTAKDRLYCANPTCSKFIPPSAIQDEIGTCPGCDQRTHLTCRSFEHPGVDCPMDEALQGVLKIAEGENWQRCFHCRTMVELQHGCHHITCRCGRQFCYICGLVWKTCNCVLWEEQRLTHMANQAIGEELRPDANVAERRNAFDRIVEGLRNHEEVGCEHHRNSQWAWRDRGSLECEFCNHELPEYIFMCKNCRIRACNRCRRHRMR